MRIEKIRNLKLSVIRRLLAQEFTIEDIQKGSLQGADLHSANLVSADLRSADLRSADLYSANLVSADLSFSNLESADMRYTTLEFADLTSADLKYVMGNGREIQTIQTDSAHVNITDNVVWTGYNVEPLSEWTESVTQFKEKWGSVIEEIVKVRKNEKRIV